MNQVILVGRLTADPEVRYTKTGKAVCSFTVAVNRGNAKAGDQDTADFIPVVAWDKLAEMCGNNLGKGNRVFIQGKLQIRSYETQDGQKRRVSEVVADLVAQNFDSAKAPEYRSSPRADAATAFGGRDVFPPDEEIPF